MKIYQSGEDYLKATPVLQKKLGMVRSVDVSRHMGVSKSSVCHAVATLQDGGFLRMDEEHFLHLTDIGREVAENIYEKHCFFTERLIAAGVDPKTAGADVFVRSYQALPTAAVLKHIQGRRSFIPHKRSNAYTLTRRL